jgi:hypothetical protein
VEYADGRPPITYTAAAAAAAAATTVAGAPIAIIPMVLPIILPMVLPIGLPMRIMDWIPETNEQTLRETFACQTKLLTKDNGCSWEKDV